MAMLIYVTGNGYNCGCCRRTDQDYTHFDEDSIESLIKECIELSRYAEGDFSIRTIEGYGGDADELEKRIMDAITAAEQDVEQQKKIVDLKHQISEIDRWFDTLEAQKSAKAENRRKFVDSLKELGVHHG